mgnify:CR=1 FL=1
MNKLPLSLFLIGIVIFISIPEKDFLSCKSHTYLDKTIEVRSYLFGFKHTIDNFTLFDCSTLSSKITCQNKSSKNSLDRIDLIYKEFEYGQTKFYQCQKVSRKY